MENEIVKLDKTIRQDPNWSIVSQSLNLSQLQSAFSEASHLTHNFIFTQDNENKSVLGSMWNRLMILENEIFKMYDRTGYTALVGYHAKNFLSSFQFSKAEEFKQFEMQTLSHINIPEKIWDKIWITVDENKHKIFEDLINRKDQFTFRNFLI